MIELNYKQGSEEWLASRLGVLTGSVVGDIMPGARGGYSEARENLLIQKAIEYLASVDESQPIPQKYADWGHKYEAEACEAVSKFTEMEFREIGLIKLNEFVGSSLDRLSVNGETALEVKCPFFMASHVKHIRNRPAVELTSKSKDYYWQVRHHLLVSNADVCIWASYHPTFAPKKLHVEFIERDEKEITLLKSECDKFVDEMLKLCKQIIKV